MTDFYDREGNPLELLDWARKFEDTPYKSVALTPVPGGRFISTVWMGFNQSPALQEYSTPHHIFETALLGGQNAYGVPGVIEVIGRWDTEAEALEGHSFAVAAEGGEVA